MRVDEMTLDQAPEPPAADGAESPSTAPKPLWRSPWARLGIFAVLLLVVVIVARVNGWTDSFSLEGLRSGMQAAGTWGIVFLVVAMAVGNLLQIPGFVFVAAAVAVYGKLNGGLIGYAGALCALSFSFMTVRLIGGKALQTIQKPLMRKVLAHLDKRPIMTVGLLRWLFFISPPLNYALALSNLSLRKYLVGSALGVLAPMMVVVLATDCALTWVV